MIRVGLVDCDTSHVVQFTMRMNHVDIAEDQWVEGAQVVAAYRGTSEITPEETIDQYVEKLRGFGIEMVGAPEEMLGKVDAVCVESQSGYVHLPRVTPFLKAGIPCFVDKPFACTVEDARAMADLAKANGAALFSSSSLRYALEIVDALQNEAIGPVVGAMAYSPASIHDKNPGLFHYGIHAVEPLYALMGRGCKSVTCTFTEGGEVVTGLWEDGRVASLRGTRAGAHAYGFTVWGEKGVKSSPIDASYIYRELLKRMVRMFETNEAPLDIEETVEIVAFIAAALRSAQQGGAPVALP
ncbi:MAG: gfo/Idh/MocA family oxidoreductase [Armatimonadetes bacterium]|nr:gfo/Idh/MocA family oxidoreductase [Armatimonadota bacterium]